MKRDEDNMPKWAKVFLASTMLSMPIAPFLVPYLIGRENTISNDNTGIRTERVCESYQGYNVLGDEVFYVFDANPIPQRIGPARLSVRGNSSLSDSLLNGESIGKRFCVEYREPLSFLGEKSIRSVQKE